MLAQLLTCDTVSTSIDCHSWQAAVREGVKLLISKNAVKESYADAIITNHQKFGPYMVIAPGVMLAHARPEEGVLKLAMSLIVLKEPIKFGNSTNDPVKIVITLGAPDNVSHLKALTELMDVLTNHTVMKKILKATTQEDVLTVIRQYP